jgi:hypothetical protein
MVVNTVYSIPGCDTVYLGKQVPVYQKNYTLSCLRKNSDSYQHGKYRCHE